VVRGEAGIGKSVLLQRIRRRAEAQGSRALVTSGVESEAEPDSFRVSVAAFQLICEVADSAPLVLIVDEQAFAWLPEEDFVTHFASDVDRTARR
jgi:predicted ATP-dependent serine protease